MLTRLANGLLLWCLVWVAAGPSLAQTGPNKPFFVERVPAPLASLRIEDFPGNENVGPPLRYRDRVYVVGDTGLLEYDAAKPRLLAFSDPRQARCARFGLGEAAIVGNRLFATCRAPGAGDEDPGALYEVDLDKRALVAIWDSRRGLSDVWNLDLLPDGNVLWIGTFKGLGRLDVKRSKLDFLASELGVKGTHFAVRPVHADGTGAWFHVRASAECEGGLVFFEKRSQQYRAFGPKQLKTDQTRFDLDDWAAAPGGLIVSFHDRSPKHRDRDVVLVKKYTYSDGTWTLLEERGIADHRLGAKYKRAAPKDPNEDRSADMVYPCEAPGQQCQVPRTRVRQLSPVLNGRRYVLTRTSIDVIDEKLALPQPLVRLGGALVAESNCVYRRPGTHFFIEPARQLAIVVEAGDCGPSEVEGEDGPDLPSHYWVADLARARILRSDALETTRVSPDDLDDPLTLKKVAKYLVLAKKQDGSMLLFFDEATGGLVQRTP